MLVPGKGILVIETKVPGYVKYKAGDWYLGRVPQPHEDPLKQLDGVRRSIHRHLNNLDLLRSGSPTTPPSRMALRTLLTVHVHLAS